MKGDCGCSLCDGYENRKKIEELEIGIEVLRTTGEEHPNDKGIKRALVVLERSLRDAKGENRYAATKANVVPGDYLYVPADVVTAVADVCFRGGKATIKEVKTWNGGNLVVEFEEFPGRQYNLAYLLGEQPKLREQYGDQWARPDPDFGYYGDE